MGANDLGVRFSNNIYATQQDVKKSNENTINR